jgi:hypothetical protein
LPFQFAAILPCVCRLYGKTIATYYENVHRWQIWKMERNKKTSGIPFTLEKLRESADVIMKIKIKKICNKFYSYSRLFFLYLRLNCLQLSYIGDYILFDIKRTRFPSKILDQSSPKK